jgi:hypothetical protein
MRRALLVALAAASTAAAQERTYVDVGSPNFQPLPIAVAAFQGDGDVRGAEVSDVVRSDLALSGLFDVLDPKGFLADPAEGFAAPSIKFARWADVGADGLVKARVRRAGGDLAPQPLRDVGVGVVAAETHRFAQELAPHRVRGRRRVGLAGGVQLAEARGCARVAEEAGAAKPRRYGVSSPTSPIGPRI